MARRYVIVGNGPAGVAAAETIRDHDADADIRIVAQRRRRLLLQARSGLPADGHRPENDSCSPARNWRTRMRASAERWGRCARSNAGSTGSSWPTARRSTTTACCCRRRPRRAAGDARHRPAGRGDARQPAMTPGGSSASPDGQSGRASSAAGSRRSSWRKASRRIGSRPTTSCAATATGRASSIRTSPRSSRSAWSEDGIRIHRGVELAGIIGRKGRVSAVETRDGARPRGATSSRSRSARSRGWSSRSRWASRRVAASGPTPPSRRATPTSSPPATRPRCSTRNRQARGRQPVVRRDRAGTRRRGVNLWRSASHTAGRRPSTSPRSAG